MFPSEWHVIGASVTGTSHLHNQHVCDDAHVYRVHGSDLLLITVADGAGSALQAATGAQLAVQAALARAELLLLHQIEPGNEAQWQSVLTQILTFAHEELLRQAEKESIFTAAAGDLSPASAARSSARDFATTLLVAIVSARWLAVAQIGDGAVVMQQTNGALVSLTPPHQREYVNETSFLTDANYLTLARYTILPRSDLQSLALLTDGLEPVALNLPANTPYTPFFHPLFKFAAKPDAQVQDLADFLLSERVCSRTDDDKTLVLAVHQ